MKRLFALSLAASLLPLAAFALPVVGDVVGTNAKDVTAVLEKAGCTVGGFENEGGKIDARCTDTTTGKLWEVMIDPKTGVVASLKTGD